ncbi:MULTISPECIES: glycosyltransferase family 39 protein [Mycetohabitans]|uniref:glycosyltransferase family 39 protein n=1 Tax=Mycetohabitans TaxID=2571159 RepID=UPI001F39AF3F|nr:glycosyltransferase family 39 protein [Mycetohabitans sp. B3]MCF2134773.1 glycosyltransferase family 39 protein [Mycetohabitans sp. B3]
MFYKTGIDMKKKGGVDCDLRMLWLLPIHAAVWTFAAWLSWGNLDRQGDMVENYVWGIEWQAGYSKHPPLFAWITAAWFRVFPHTDIAYFSLSSLNVMVGLLGIVALAKRFLPARLAVLAGLAMAVSPLYSNLAIKFNANAVLLSLWPWTAYFFVCFMQNRRVGCAIALGVLSGVSMLGKYFSAVLLIALCIVAFVYPAWRATLLSWRSWLVAGTAAVVVLPHLHWLVVNDFPTLHYAQNRAGGTLGDAIARFCTYTAAQLGYLLPSFCFVILLAGARWRQAALAMARSCVTPSRHAGLWWLVAGPLIVVGAIAVVAKTQMASVWGMAQWFAIVPFWLMVLRRDGFEITLERVPRVMLTYWLIVLTIAPIVGWLAAKRNTEGGGEPRAELAVAASDLWRQRMGGDVPIVGGAVHEAQSIAFYGRGRTRFWDFRHPHDTPWVSATDVARQGALLVCRDGDRDCIAAASSISAVSPTLCEVQKRAWGMTLPARRYQLFLMPPRL